MKDILIIERLVTWMGRVRVYFKVGFLFLFKGAFRKDLYKIVYMGQKGCKYEDLKKLKYFREILELSEMRS